jgi:Protein of unknown function (DUF3303)
MKYVVAWKPRTGGSAAENEASGARALQIVSKWTPSPDTTIHQFVFRVDGEGGFAVVESDNPADIAGTIGKFASVAEYTVYPVLDSDEGLRVANESLEFLKSIS